MVDFEKLGAFYLGRKAEPGTNDVSDELVLYDSKDLTTHALIIGMTGSGKTGLGIGLIEEALLDHVPVIAIDPKGDLGNLLLTFPDLAPRDFRPWINERQATERGLSPEEFATEQAALWKKGLAEWGQDSARIAKLRESAEMAIYTPGSTAGLPVSVLQSFRAPAGALRQDADLYRERIQATVTGLLSLVDLEADPLTSRERILLSRILDQSWTEGRNPDLAGLIAAIQEPPFDRVGVMSLSSFFPPQDRFKLAMRLNNLLAAPGFEAWTRGAPLDPARFFYTDAGKPRVSVLSIAHLADAERMFFVCMLLNELIAWMRSQQGTSSLRAVLYMDELFGYMPPVAEPPSKRLFLTLLKQARAYGLGVVLATQNPVDLDYKGLSNTGTWFIGRLQTERDKARVMEGLEGASQGGQFDRAFMEQTLAGLGERRFLLHNVHEDRPVVFHTRWVMSYLAGPLTRDQIRSLTPAAERESAASEMPAAATPSAGRVEAAAPLLPPSIRQFYLPAGRDVPVCVPRLVAAAEIVLSNSRHSADETRRVLYAIGFGDEGAPDWEGAEKLPVDEDALEDRAPEGATYAACPPAATDAANYARWEKDFGRWLRQNETIRLYKSARFRMTSTVGESEGEFRARLQHKASEERDAAIADIRKRYATKATTLEDRLLRAEQAVARQSEQSNRKVLDSAVSFGTALLGAVLGRKRFSASTASRIGTAIRSAGGVRNEAADVARAGATAAKVRADIEQLNASLQEEIDALDTAYDAQGETLSEVVIKAKVADVQVTRFGLLWMPRRDTGRP